MTGKKYDVAVTESWKIFLLFASVVLFFFSSNFLFQLLELSFWGTLISIALSVALYYLCKKLTIQNKVLFLSKNKIEIDHKAYFYDDLISYKTQRFSGVSLKLKSKGGKTFSITCNDNFCDSLPLSRFVDDFEKRATDHPHIKKIKSFGERKTGLYISIVLTVLLCLSLGYQLIYNDEPILSSQSSLLLVSLTILWSGIEIKKIWKK